MSSRYASLACQARNAGHRGLASAASGTSHSVYCGEKTLLLTRKATTVRNSSAGRRGRRGANHPSAATPRRSIPRTIVETMLSVPVGIPLSRTAPSTSGTVTATSSHPTSPASAIGTRRAGRREAAVKPATASRSPTSSMTIRCRGPNARGEKEPASHVVANARESQSGPRCELRSTKRSIAFVAPPEWPPNRAGQSPPAQNVVQMLSPVR